MKVSRFDFDLPEELIAEKPAEPRESARLLNISKDKISDQKISDLPNLLKKGDIIVFNNTKVIPARIKGKRGDANIEITLHKKITNKARSWSAFAKPAKKLKPGDIFKVSDNFHAEVLEKLENGEVVLEFNLNDSEFDQYLHQHGEPPLPPYIVKKRAVKDSDKENYQTIFAKISGAVAAPTAGLHFTEDLFNKLDEIGAIKTFVTLHVGGGTFLPVKVEDTKDHKMHSEWCEISEETCNLINEAKEKGNRIIAVGTTALRTLEAAANKTGRLEPFANDTDIFITPGFNFNVVDILLTNFHLPRSTLFMLVSAFAGEKEMLKAYKHAIEQEYRFYSYGDACLLEKNSHQLPDASRQDVSATGDGRLETGDF